MEVRLALLEVGTRLPALLGPERLVLSSKTWSCRDMPMLTSARSATPSAEKKSMVSLNESMIPWKV